MKTRVSLQYFVNACRYQIGLETSMEGSEFASNCVQLLYYKCHKKNPNRGGSYIDSPDWIKNKKCFQNAITVALNHEKIEEHPEIITKIKFFISNYNGQGKISPQKNFI